MNEKLGTLKIPLFFLLFLVSLGLTSIGCSKSTADSLQDLQSEETGVRQQAIDDLASCGEKCIPDLINALGSDRLPVATGAAQVLIKIGKPAVQPVIDALQKSDNETIRSRSATVLGGLKDPQATEPLIGALKDQNAAVRSPAALSLGNIGDPRAIEPLKAALNDPKINSEVQRALYLLQSP